MNLFFTRAPYTNDLNTEYKFLVGFRQHIRPCHLL